MEREQQRWLDQRLDRKGHVWSKRQTMERLGQRKGTLLECVIDVRRSVRDDEQPFHAEQLFVQWEKTRETTSKAMLDALFEPSPTRLWTIDCAVTASLAWIWSDHWRPSSIHLEENSLINTAKEDENVSLTPIAQMLSQSVVDRLVVIEVVGEISIDLIGIESDIERNQWFIDQRTNDFGQKLRVGEINFPFDLRSENRRWLTRVKRFIGQCLRKKEKHTYTLDTVFLCEDRTRKECSRMLSSD